MRSAIQKIFDTEAQLGVLALAPFFLIISSFDIAFHFSLIIFIQIFILTSVLYLLRNLIRLQQRIVVVLIFSATMALITRMLLYTEAYAVADTLGLFLPLLLINSLVLSLGESVFSKQSYQSAICHAARFAIVIPIFFILFGLLRHLLEPVSIVASPAGCFFLLGFLFVACHFAKADSTI